MTAAKDYRQAEAVCGADPIEAGLVGSLTDHECSHGRLPNDATSRCGCWAEEGVTLQAVGGGRHPLPPQILREIRGLRREGLSTGAIVVVVNRYFSVTVTYSQVQYHLLKSGVARPKIRKGRVIA